MSLWLSGIARGVWGVRSAPGSTFPGTANGRKFRTILKHPIDPNLTFYENNTSPATCDMVNLSSIGLVHLNRMSIRTATKGQQNTSTAPGGQTSCYATAVGNFISLFKLGFRPKLIRTIQF